MPIPFIIAAAGWAVAAAGTGYAGKKGYDAYKNNSSAKEIVENARKKFEEAKSSLEKKQEETQQSLDDLGRYKSEVFEKQIGHIVSVVTKFKSKLAGFDESFEIENLDERIGDADVSLHSGEIAKDMAKGVFNGVVKGAQAATAVGQICNLAGAAPAAGTLGYLARLKKTVTGIGGGNVAKTVSKYPVILPVIVIGGVALAAYTGYKFAAETEKNLTKAKEYEAEIEKVCEEMQLIAVTLDGVRTNCEEVTSVIEKLVEMFEKYKVYNLNDQDKLRRMLIIGKNLKDVLNEPIINKDGSAVENLKVKCSGYLELNY